MRQQILEVEGIQEALAELNKIDPKYRRQVTKRIKNSGQIIINEARSMVAHFDNSKGTGEPLSGMRRGNLIKGRETSWRTDQVQKGYKIKVGVRATRERYVDFNKGGYTEQVVFGSKPYKLMVVQSTDPAGVIYDHAGRNTDGLFVTNLTKEEGGQPRVIDTAVEKNKPAVQKDVELVIDDVEKMTNRNLKRRTR
jgi:hypothetical protein